MKDTGWICSILTDCFFPSFRPYQASGPSAEYFDKSGPRQLYTHTVQALCLLDHHDSTIILQKTAERKILMGSFHDSGVLSSIPIQYLFSSGILSFAVL